MLPSLTLTTKHSDQLHSQVFQNLEDNLIHASSLTGMFETASLGMRTLSYWMTELWYQLPADPKSSNHYMLLIRELLVCLKGPIKQSTGQAWLPTSEILGIIVNHAMSEPHLNQENRIVRPLLHSTHFSKSVWIILKLATILIFPVWIDSVAG